MLQNIICILHITCNKKIALLNKKYFIINEIIIRFIATFIIRTKIIKNNNFYIFCHKKYCNLS